MPRKIDPAMLDHRVIRRALQDAGEYEAVFSSFTATWEDSRTRIKVDFVGEIDSEISLRTARIHGSDEVYDLRKMFTESELRAFNYAINVEQKRRARSAA